MGHGLGRPDRPRRAGGSGTHVPRRSRTATMPPGRRWPPRPAGRAAAGSRRATRQVAVADEERIGGGRVKGDEPDLGPAGKPDGHGAVQGHDRRRPRSPARRRGRRSPPNPWPPMTGPQRERRRCPPSAQTGPGVGGPVVTNPAMLAGVAGIMAQIAMQQTMAEITDYLATIDESSTTSFAPRRTRCWRVSTESSRGQGGNECPRGGGSGLGGHLVEGAELGSDDS